MQDLHDILGQHLYTTLINHLNQNDYNSLEIGVFNGTGTAMTGKAFPEKVIYAIDPFIEDGNTDWITNVGKGNQLNIQKQNCYNNIKDLSNVTLFEETSKNFSNRLTNKMIHEMNIGGVIIDGDHSYDAVVIDYEVAIRVIDKKKNSIIIFDDINQPDVLKALNEFLEKYKNDIYTVEYVYDSHAIAYIAIIKIY